MKDFWATFYVNGIQHVRKITTESMVEAADLAVRLAMIQNDGAGDWSFEGVSTTFPESLVYNEATVRTLEKLFRKNRGGSP